jgi:hypothetical protein
MRGTQIKQADEVRVFAHDAKPVDIGAVNTSAEDGGISSLTNAGTGYAVASGVGTTVAPVGGTGLTVNILSVDTGVITSFEIAAIGSGYSVDDVVTISGGGANATFTITNVDIPGTENRGVCLYVGDVTTSGSDVEVVMESGNTAMFKGVTAGSFLPVLVTSLTNNTTASEILALY